MPAPHPESSSVASVPRIQQGLARALVELGETELLLRAKNEECERLRSETETLQAELAEARQRAAEAEEKMMEANKKVSSLREEIEPLRGLKERLALVLGTVETPQPKSSPDSDPAPFQQP